MNRYGRIAMATGMVTVLSGALLVAGTPASAAPHEALVSVTAIGPTVHFHAGTGTVNEVYVYPVAGGFHIEDVVGSVRLQTPSNNGCVLVTNHIVMCSSTTVYIEVTLADGNDYYNNTSAVPSTVDGGDGDDSLLGGTASDRFQGGPGRDTLHGGYGNDILEGGAGADAMFGQAGDDSLRSTDEYDDLWGGPGNDDLVASRSVHGDDGNDLVTMTRNTGDIWGGTEFDRIVYTSWTEDVYVSLDGNANDGNWGSACDDWFGCPVAERHNVHGDFEKIVGSAHNDRLIGNNNNNLIDGGPGNDRIDGRGGDDYLDAEGGSGQKVYGGGGNDTCVGFGLTVRESCEH